MNPTETISATPKVPAAKWLEVMRDEYLRTYIPSGGASVRFLSGPRHVLNDVSRQLVAEAARDNFHAVLLETNQFQDGARPDLHRIEKFFFAASDALDWPRLAEKQVRGILQRNCGLFVPGDQPLRLESLAAANGCTVDDVTQQFNHQFANQLLRDRVIEYEFRAAMNYLGRSQLIPEHLTPATEEVLLAWLRGQPVKGGAAALRNLAIFQRITAKNARHIFRSVCHWLPQVGYQGAVLVLDMRPYCYSNRGATERNILRLQEVRAKVFEPGATIEDIRRLFEAEEETIGLRYSDQAYLAMLALLRRFIDEIDLFEHLLLVVLASPSFFEHPEKGKRTWYDYDALRTRISQEVFDARHPNPSAALVHLGDER